jgi:hypothetical protein
MGFGVGVAIADTPEGPFVCEPEPIKGINGIDPCVLLASDGNAYIFWGNGRCAKLKDNMKEIADDTPKEKVKWGEREFEMYGVNCLKGLRIVRLKGRSLSSTTATITLLIRTCARTLRFLATL